MQTFPDSSSKNSGPLQPDEVISEEQIKHYAQNLVSILENISKAQSMDDFSEANSDDLMGDISENMAEIANAESLLANKPEQIKKFFNDLAKQNNQLKEIIDKINGSNPTFENINSFHDKFCIIIILHIFNSHALKNVSADPSTEYNNILSFIEKLTSQPIGNTDILLMLQTLFVKRIKETFLPNSIKAICNNIFNLSAEINLTSVAEAVNTFIEFSSQITPNNNSSKQNQPQTSNKKSILQSISNLVKKRDETIRPNQTHQIALECFTELFKEKLAEKFKEVPLNIANDFLEKINKIFNEYEKYLKEKQISTDIIENQKKDLCEFTREQFEKHLEQSSYQAEDPYDLGTSIKNLSLLQNSYQALIKNGFILSYVTEQVSSTLSAKFSRKAAENTAPLQAKTEKKLKEEVLAAVKAYSHKYLDNEIKIIKNELNEEKNWLDFSSKHEEYLSKTYQNIKTNILNCFENGILKLFNCVQEAEIIKSISSNQNIVEEFNKAISETIQTLINEKLSPLKNILAGTPKLNPQDFKLDGEFFSTIITALKSTSDLNLSLKKLGWLKLNVFGGHEDKLDSFFNFSLLFDDLFQTIFKVYTQLIDSEDFFKKETNISQLATAIEYIKNHTATVPQKFQSAYENSFNNKFYNTLKTQLITNFKLKIQNCKDIENIGLLRKIHDEFRSNKFYNSLLNDEQITLNLINLKESSLLETKFNDIFSPENNITSIIKELSNINENLYSNLEPKIKSSFEKYLTEKYPYAFFKETELSNIKDKLIALHEAYQLFTNSTRNENSLTQTLLQCFIYHNKNFYKEINTYISSLQINLTNEESIRGEACLLLQELNNNLKEQEQVWIQNIEKTIIKKFFTPSDSLFETSQSTDSQIIEKFLNKIKYYKDLNHKKLSTDNNKVLLLSGNINNFVNEKILEAFPKVLNQVKGPLLEEIKKLDLTDPNFEVFFNNLNFKLNQLQEVLAQHDSKKESDAYKEFENFKVELFEKIEQQFEVIVKKEFIKLPETDKDPQAFITIDDLENLIKDYEKKLNCAAHSNYIIKLNLTNTENKIQAIVHKQFDAGKEKLISDVFIKYSDHIKKISEGNSFWENHDENLKKTFDQLKQYQEFATKHLIATQSSDKLNKSITEIILKSFLQHIKNCFSEFKKANKSPKPKDLNDLKLILKSVINKLESYNSFVIQPKLAQEINSSLTKEVVTQLDVILGNYQSQAEKEFQTLFNNNSNDPKELPNKIAEKMKLIDQFFSDCTILFAKKETESENKTLKEKETKSENKTPIKRYHQNILKTIKKQYENYINSIQFPKQQDSNYSSKTFGQFCLSQNEFSQHLNNIFDCLQSHNELSQDDKLQLKKTLTQTVNKKISNNIQDFIKQFKNQIETQARNPAFWKNDNLKRQAEILNSFVTEPNNTEANLSEYISLNKESISNLKNEISQIIFNLFLTYADEVLNPQKKTKSQIIKGVEKFISRNTDSTPIKMTSIENENPQIQSPVPASEQNLPSEEVLASEEKITKVKTIYELFNTIKELYLVDGKFEQTFSTIFNKSLTEQELKGLIIATEEDILKNLKDSVDITTLIEHHFASLIGQPLLNFDDTTIYKSLCVNSLRSVCDQVILKLKPYSSKIKLFIQHPHNHNLHHVISVATPYIKENIKAHLDKFFNNLNSQLIDLICKNDSESLTKLGAKFSENYETLLNAFSQKSLLKVNEKENEAAALLEQAKRELNSRIEIIKVLNSYILEPVGEISADARSVQTFFEKIITTQEEAKNNNLNYDQLITYYLEHQVPFDIIFKSLPVLNCFTFKISNNESLKGFIKTKFRNYIIGLANTLSVFEEETYAKILNLYNINHESFNDNNLTEIATRLIADDPIQKHEIQSYFVELLDELTKQDYKLSDYESIWNENSNIENLIKECDKKIKIFKLFQEFKRQVPRRDGKCIDNSQESLIIDKINADKSNLILLNTLKKIEAEIATLKQPLENLQMLDTESINALMNPFDTFNISEKPDSGSIKKKRGKKRTPTILSADSPRQDRNKKDEVEELEEIKPIHKKFPDKSSLPQFIEEQFKRLHNEQKDLAIRLKIQNKLIDKYQQLTLVKVELLNPLEQVAHFEKLFNLRNTASEGFFGKSLLANINSLISKLQPHIILDKKNINQFYQRDFSLKIELLLNITALRQKASKPDDIHFIEGIDRTISLMQEDLFLSKNTNTVFNQNYETKIDLIQKFNRFISSYSDTIQSEELLYKIKEQLKKFKINAFETCNTELDKFKDELEAELEKIKQDRIASPQGFENQLKNLEEQIFNFKKHIDQLEKTANQDLNLKPELEKAQQTFEEKVTESKKIIELKEQETIQFTLNQFKNYFAEQEVNSLRENDFKTFKNFLQRNKIDFTRIPLEVKVAAEKYFKNRWLSALRKLQQHDLSGLGLEDIKNEQADFEFLVRLDLNIELVNTKRFLEINDDLLRQLKTIQKNLFSAEPKEPNVTLDPHTFVKSIEDLNSIQIEINSFKQNFTSPHYSFSETENKVVKTKEFFEKALKWITTLNDMFNNPYSYMQDVVISAQESQAISFKQKDYLLTLEKIENEYIQACKDYTSALGIQNNGAIPLMPKVINFGANDTTYSTFGRIDSIPTTYAQRIRTKLNEVEQDFTSSVVEEPIENPQTMNEQQPIILTTPKIRINAKLGKDSIPDYFYKPITDGFFISKSISFGQFNEKLNQKINPMFREPAGIIPENIISPEKIQIFIKKLEKYAKPKPIIGFLHNFNNKHFRESDKTLEKNNMADSLYNFLLMNQENMDTGILKAIIEYYKQLNDLIPNTIQYKICGKPLTQSRFGKLLDDFLVELDEPNHKKNLSK